MTKVIYTGVAGVARKVKQPYIGVDSTARKVKKGYIGVNGVARQFFASGTPISEFAVGTSVYLNVNGTPTEFIIVNQGIPSNSSLYDSSCNGTWLLMKDIYELRAWDSTDNDYKNSDIHAYLNKAFLNLFDSDMQSVIKQVKIPYQNGTGTGGSVASGANGLSAKIFLLGAYETGWTSYANADSAKLDYFSSDNSAQGSGGRIAYYNGTATVWWTRSPYNLGTNQSVDIYNNGLGMHNAVTVSWGIRPALILPSDTPVDENMNVLA